MATEEISEELDRYSLELSEDESSQPKEEVKVPSIDIPIEKTKTSGDKHGIKVCQEYFTALFVSFLEKQ